MVLCAYDDKVGFLPASYLEKTALAETPPKPPQPQPTGPARPPPEERIYVAHVAFEPEDTESEMRMRTGDRVMLLQPHDGSGWAEVELLSESNGGMESGFVPWGYLQQCPPDGAMLAVFQGQTEGEVSEATEGEGVWRTDARAAAGQDGWEHVYLASGVLGYVPSSYVSWGAPPSSPPVGVARAAATAAPVAAAATGSGANGQETPETEASGDEDDEDMDLEL